MKNKVITPPTIPVGTPIIYYNKWTGFSTVAFEGQFEYLSIKELRNLKISDVVYSNIHHPDDPYVKAHGVFGCIKVVITGTEKIEAGGVRIQYCGGPWKEYVATPKCTNHTIAKAVDEATLARLVAENPLSTVISPHDR